MVEQRRHESPDVGDAVKRMLRALVLRAQEGDTEAVEQLAELEQLSKVACTLALRLAHEEAGYSYAFLGGVIGTSRQGVRQRILENAGIFQGIGHILLPGHNRRTCDQCQ